MSKGLFTRRSELTSNKEWLQHRLHSILGAYVFGHFVYRYALFFFGNVPDMGFHKDQPYQLLSFVPHAILQLSGFSFKLPSKRHPEGNRIWSEYRWHALVFFFRSMALILLAQTCKNGSFLCGRTVLPIPIERLVTSTIFLLNMVCVDSITKHYKSLGLSSSTIRGLKGPRMLKYFMSVTQFHANINCLLTRDKIRVQLAAIAVVQGSAFGMTLRRKCLIDHAQGLFLYSLVLFLGMLVIVDDLLEQKILFLALTLANVTAILRIDLGVNKYLLWSVVSLVVLPMVENHGHQIIWKPAVLVSAIGLFLNGYRHQRCSCEKVK